MTPIATIDLTGLDGDPKALAFEYTDPFGRPAHGVLLRWNGKLYAYRNLCPHWSMPLDADTGEFFDDNESVLHCKMHGARFDPATGDCVMGPCEGDRLEKLRVELSDDGDTALVFRRGLSL
jgi:nitrite reductase/ring-hydroxylating ferredoxin subunit